MSGSGPPFALHQIAPYVTVLVRPEDKSSESVYGSLSSTANGLVYESASSCPLSLRIETGERREREREEREKEEREREKDKRER